MEFLIQHNLLNDKSLNKIRVALEKGKLPHKFIGVIPFSRELVSDDDIQGKDYIPYGSTLLTTLAYELYNWKGLYFDLSNFNYEMATANRDDMLNSHIILSAKDTLDFMKKEKPDKCWFVRPSLDLKQFSGLEIESKECYEWLEDAMLCDSSGSYRISEDTMIVIAHPQEIKAEWRWFVIDGKVISGSMYRRAGCLYLEEAVEKDLIEEAQSMVDGKWLPCSCCVMDLALTKNGLKVIEFNCINSSGFYNHNIQAILTQLFNYTLRKT
jgi:hypothetical protein